MSTATATPAKERKPTKEHFADGRRKPKKADPNDSPPAPPTKRACYTCGEGGGSFTTVRDIDNTIQMVHTPVNIGDSSAMFTECQKTFEATRRQDALRKVREHQEDLALAALQRQSGKTPSLLGPEMTALVASIEQRRKPTREFFDCESEGCERFFDSSNGRDLHLRKQHKTIN